MELVRCFDNFARPHGALGFGKVTRTPAMQAGLVAKELSYKEVFAARDVAARLAVARMRAVSYREPIETFRWAA